VGTVAGRAPGDHGVLQFLCGYCSYPVSVGRCAAKTDEHGGYMNRGISRKLVGAGRFERPTPCAQGSEIAPHGSIGFGEFLVVTTVRGICFRSRSKFIGWNGSGSDTVLAQ
jgi:hypothetical protein